MSAPIINVDQLIEEYARSQVKDQQLPSLLDTFSPEEMELFKQYGYQEVQPMTNVQRALGFSGVPGAPQAVLGEDQVAEDRRLSSAIRRGIEQGQLSFTDPRYLDRLTRSDIRELLPIEYDKGPGFNLERDFLKLPSSLKNEENIQYMLQNAFSKEFKIPRTFDYDVEIDPLGETFTYIDPRDNKRRAVESSGFDAPDLSLLAQRAIPEIVAGVLGAAAGAYTSVPTAGTINPFTGSVLAETATTYGMRLAELNDLKEKYPLIFLDNPEFSINGRALADAGITAGFAVGGQSLFQIFKNVSRTTSSSAVPVDVEDFEKGLEIVKKEGIDPQELTSSQIETVGVTARGGDASVSRSRTAELESEARGAPRGMVIQKSVGPDIDVVEKFDKQAGISSGIVTSQVGKAGDVGEDTAQVFGRDVQAEAKGVVTKELSSPKANLENIKVETDKIFRGVVDGSIDSASAGNLLKEQLEILKKNAFKEVDDAYTSIIKNSNKNYSFVFNGSPYQKQLLKSLKEVKQSASPDQRLIKELEELISGVADLGSSPKNYTFLKNTIQDIRARKGNQSGRGFKVFDDIENSLLNFRKKAFSGEDLNKALKADEMYENYVNNYTKGVIDKVIKSGDDVSAETFLKTLKGTFVGKESILKQVMNDPAFAVSAENIKGLIKRKYRESVLDEVDGLLKPKSPGAHEKFMNQYGDVVDEYFPDQKALFNSAESFASGYKKSLQDIDDLIKNINSDKAFEIKLSKTQEPEFIFKNVGWKPEAITKTEKLFKLIENNPELLARYKAFIGQDIMENITDSSGKIFASRIDPYLAKYGAQLDSVFGKEFREGLEQVSEKLKIYEVPEKAGKLTAEESLAVKLVRTGARAYTGIFTTRGRILTFLQQLMQRGGDSRAVELLVDPNALNRVIQRGKFFEDPLVNNIIRQLGRTQYRTDFIEPLPGGEQKPPQGVPEDSVTEVLQEDILRNMNRGGAIQTQMIPLKYNFGERS